MAAALLCLWRRRLPEDGIFDEDEDDNADDDETTWINDDEQLVPVMEHHATTRYVVPVLYTVLIQSG